jgi:NTE family protein
MSKVGLALGGGSSKGLCHIGVLKALEEANIPISYISGTSMGAIIGAVYCVEKSYKKVEEIARDFTSSGAFRNLGLSVFKKEEGGRIQQFVHSVREKMAFAEALFKSHLVESEDLEESLNKIIPHIRFEDTVIPFSAVSLDLVSGMDIIRRTGSLRKGVMSSMAIPGLFPFVEENNYMLVDGGSTSSVPVYATREMGADIVIAISTRGRLSKDKKPKTGLEIHLRIDEIVVTRIIEEQTRSADVIIRPDVQDVHWANFERLDYCIEQGYKSAKAALPLIKEKIREKSRILNRIRGLFSRRKKYKNKSYQMVAKDFLETKE